MAVVEEIRSSAFRLVRKQRDEYIRILQEKTALSDDGDGKEEDRRREALRPICPNSVHTGNC